jgi:hypothetical protein
VLLKKVVCQYQKWNYAVQHRVVLDDTLSFIYDNGNWTGCIKIKLFLNSIAT